MDLPPMTTDPGWQTLPLLLRSKQNRRKTEEEEEEE